MQSKTLQSGFTIKYYFDYEEWPVNRRGAWGQFLAYSSGLDHTWGEMVAHTQEIMKRLEWGDVSDVKTLCINLYMSVESIRALDLPSNALALGCLIAEVDGVPATDLSESGLKNLIRRIKPTCGEVDQVLAEVKKNFHQGRKMLFSSLSGDEETETTYRNYLLTQLDLALEPERTGELTAALVRLERQLLGKPVILQPDHPHNYVVEEKKAQEELFFVLEQRGVPSPKNLTEYEFYTRVTALQKHASRSRSENQH